MKRRNKIIITLLLTAGGILYLDALVPIYKKCYKGYNCRLCGAQKSEKTVHLWAFCIQKEFKGPTRTALTDLYDKYIAEPHDHQWTGGGYGRTIRHIYEKGGLHSDGFHGGEYPIYQFWLSRDLLSEMEMFKDETVEFRREVYRHLIECKDRMDYESARQLLKDMRTTPEDARKLYETYRLSKQ